MKAIQFFSILAIMVIGISSAQAGSKDIRDRLSAAKAQMAQEMKSIETENQLMNSVRSEIIPADYPSVSLPTLSLPGKVVLNVLLNTPRKTTAETRVKLTCIFTTSGSIHCS
jgi:hypothetical protein